MDLFKTLIELNNRIELEKLASEKYNYGSDEYDEDNLHLALDPFSSPSQSRPPLLKIFTPR